MSEETTVIKGSISQLADKKTWFIPMIDYSNNGTCWGNLQSRQTLHEAQEEAMLYSDGKRWVVVSVELPFGEMKARTP